MKSTVKEKIKNKISIDSKIPMDMLSNKIFNILARFDITDNKSIEYQFNEDYVIFEAGCYLMFLVDVWHYNNGRMEHRESVVNKIMDEFIDLFKSIITEEQANKILQNRLDLYAKIANSQEIAKTSELVTELIAKSIKGESLLIYDINSYNPVVLGEIFIWHIAVAVQEYVIAFMPLIKDALIEFYDHDSS